jgi:hypothetical protein
MDHPPGAPDLNALAALREGTLDAQERENVEEHLARCRECRATLATELRAGAPVSSAGPSATAWLAAAAGLAVATLVGVRVASTERPAPVTARPAETPAAASPEASESGTLAPAAPVPRPSAAGIDESFLPRRSGRARVGDKSFRLVAGQWVDDAYDGAALLPVVTAATAAERGALMESMPALVPFAALGDRVLVVFDGTVYRFEPPR